MASDDDIIGFGTDDQYYMDAIRGTVGDLMEQNGVHTFAPTYQQSQVGKDSTPLADMQQAFQDNGFAGLENARNMLSEMKLSYDDILEVNRAYSEVLDEQTSKMQEQNRLLAERANATTDATNTIAKTSSSQTQSSNTSDALEVAKTSLQVARAATENVAKASNEADSTHDSADVIRAVNSGRSQAQSTSEERKSSPSDFTRTFRTTAQKLGLTDVTRAMSQFDDVADKFKASAEFLGAFGDLIVQGKQPSNLAVAASIAGNSAGQMQQAAQSSFAQNIQNGLQTVNTVVDTVNGLSNLGSRAGSPAGSSVEDITQVLDTTNASGWDDALSTASDAAQIGSTATGLLGKVGGKVGSIAGVVGGVLSKAAPVLGIASAAYGLYKGVRDSMFEATEQGALQGGDMWTGYGYMAENAGQDLQNFLGLTNVSGQDLQRYRQSASRAGFDLSSDTGKSAIDVQKWAKENGISESTALSFAESMLRAGATTEDVTDALDELKDKAKETGTDLETLASAATVTGATFRRIMPGVGNDAEGMAADFYQGIRDAMGANGMQDTEQAAQGMASSSLWQTFANMNIMGNGGDMSYLIDPDLASGWIAANGQEGDVTNSMLGYIGQIAMNVAGGNQNAAYNYAYKIAKDNGLANYITDANSFAEALGISPDANYINAMDNTLGGNASSSNNQNVRVDTNVTISTTDEFSDSFNTKVNQTRYINGVAQPTSVNNYE